MGRRRHKSSGESGQTHNNNNLTIANTGISTIDTGVDGFGGVFSGGGGGSGSDCGGGGDLTNVSGVGSSVDVVDSRSFHDHRCQSHRQYHQNLHQHDHSQTGSFPMVPGLDLMISQASLSAKGGGSIECRRHLETDTVIENIYDNAQNYKIGPQQQHQYRLKQQQQQHQQYQQQHSRFHHHGHEQKLQPSNFSAKSKGLLAARSADHPFPVPLSTIPPDVPEGPASSAANNNSNRVGVTAGMDDSVPFTNANAKQHQNCFVVGTIEETDTTTMDDSGIRPFPVSPVDLADSNVTDPDLCIYDYVGPPAPLLPPPPPPSASISVSATSSAPPPLSTTYPLPYPQYGVHPPLSLHSPRSSHSPHSSLSSRTSSSFASVSSVASPDYGDYSFNCYSNGNNSYSDSSGSSVYSDVSSSDVSYNSAEVADSDSGCYSSQYKQQHQHQRQGQSLQIQGRTTTSIATPTAPSATATASTATPRKAVQPSTLPSIPGTSQQNPLAWQ